MTYLSNRWQTMPTIVTPALFYHISPTAALFADTDKDKHLLKKRCYQTNEIQSALSFHFVDITPDNQHVIVKGHHKSEYKILFRSF